MRSRLGAHARLLSWAVFALICAMFAGSLAVGWWSRGTDTRSAAWGSGGAATAFGLVLAAFVFPVVGVVITTRRPGSVVGWLLLAIGAVWGLDVFCSSYSTYGL